MRLAIVGSSHVGVLKLALPDVMADHPGLHCQFFAVPGGAFRRCRMRGQIFRAHPRSDAEAARIIGVNDDLALDVADADLIWAVGYRFGYGAALDLFLDRPADHETAVRRLIMDSVTQIAEQFGQDNRVILSPAPYPALRARAPGPKQEIRMTRIQRHPSRDADFAFFEDQITDVIANTPYRAHLQPPTTLGAPFATHNRYLEDAQDFQTGKPLTGDLRHMNAAYGRALFDSFLDRFGAG